eukprot:TRINITY_DN8067_c0_g1_i1.p1 TRINITY_DN8067_c0_g1~~TRINITY_DN8067_c0_g1_i1.p1  ORF type:complete len:536 (-),score=76.98 TRINITY_DN8067_c0_g1_i1:209-1816(-)
MLSPKRQKMSPVPLPSPRPNYKVKIHYTNSYNYRVEKEYDYLVIACDPRCLLGIADYTDEEKKIFNALDAFEFHTAVNKLDNVPIPSNVEPFALQFDIKSLKKMDGDIYALRNEYFSRVGVPLGGQEIISTSYQLVDLSRTSSTYDQRVEEMRLKREEQLRNSPWFQFKNLTTLTEKVNNYFPHFNQQHLVEGLPWDILDMQGKHNTLYVSSFTCFESVLQIFQYGKMLIKKNDIVRILPTNKNASIAIIGAGPSGLLWASQFLKKKGYTNVEILEKSDRFGGKSNTFYAPTEKGDVACELGTCYLSPSYTPIRKLISKYQATKITYKGEDRTWRRVVNLEPEMVRSKEELDYGITYAQWVERSIKNNTVNNGSSKKSCILKFFQKMTFGSIKEQFKRCKNNLYTQVCRYIQLHRQIFGKSRPIPLKRIERWDLLDKTFEKFLEDNLLFDLIPYFTYGYEAQGYGNISRIPAYYGMVWMTPETILPKKGVGTVGCLFDGFDALWRQVVRQENLNIVLSVNITKIERILDVENSCI